MSGQPRPTRSRSISVLTPADLPERGSPRAAAPHPSIRPTTHLPTPRDGPTRESSLFLPLYFSFFFSSGLAPTSSTSHSSSRTESPLPFISVRILAAKRTRVTLPWGLHAAKGTVRHRSGIRMIVGINNEGEPFPLLSRQRDEEGRRKKRRRRRRSDGWKTKRKKKKGGKREAVISVGRAGCIRSNIMQAHTGSLLECVRSLGSCPPLSSPPRGRSAAHYTAYTQNIRPRVRENGSARRDSASVRVWVYASLAPLARACPPYLRASANAGAASLRICMCVYIRLTLPA